MSNTIPLTAVLAALLGFSATAQAQATQAEPMMEHGSMGMGESMHSETNAGATGEGVIHSVDREARSVNLSHGPIPALSWPEMTMDLPVAEGVDLQGIEPGDEVRFRVVLGADQVYRISAIEVAP